MITLPKHWNTCWICNKEWSSLSPSNDCGANDPQHNQARNPPKDQPKKK